MPGMPDTIPMFPLSMRTMSEYESMRKPDFTPSYHTGNPPWAGRRGRQDSRGAKNAGNRGNSAKRR